MTPSIWPFKKSFQTETLHINLGQALDFLIPSLALCLFIGLVENLIATDFVWTNRIILWTFMLVVVSITALVQNVNYKIRSVVFIVVLFIAGFNQLLVHGLMSWGILTLTIIPLIATIYLGIRIGLISLVFTIAATISPYVFNLYSAVGVNETAFTRYGFVVIIIVFALIALTGQINLDRLVTQMKLTRNRERELVHSLKDQSQQFDKQVAIRTKAIKTSTLISQRIASILDEQSLLQTVVSQLQQETDYYYAQIYLKDGFTPSEAVYIVADSDRQGRSYIPKGYRLPISSGLIGEVMKTKKPILIEDLPASEYTIPRDPIPNSISELAVPIKLGNEVLGILDVRQDYSNGLNQDDIFLLEAVAGQLAVGIRNARLYARAQKQTLREMLVNSVREQLQSAESVQEAIEIATKAISGELETNARISIGLNS
jgi:putative methionine-R-sulfoxide reductase with GAF domain